MKKILYYLLPMTIFFSCEPSYRIYISNSSSNNLYIKTHPPIESVFFDTNSIYYKSIILHKLNQEAGYSVYKLKPYDTILILGTIGGRPTVGELPFDYISLICGSDSTILSSKQMIIEHAIRMGRKRNYLIL